MNILLFLFSLFCFFLVKILNIYYYIFKFIRVNFFKIYFNDDVDNLLSLFIRIISLTIYEFFVFHIYIFFYLIYNNEIYIGKFGIFLRFMIVFTISSIISAICDEYEYIFIYLYKLIQYILFLFIWIISFIFFILTFNDELKEIICFNRSFNGIFDLLSILFGVHLILFIQIYRYIIIFLHISNLFSIIRIIEIYKNKKERLSTLFLSKSFLYVFFDIFILTPLYSFNFIILPIFISSHIKIYKIIFNNGYNIIEEEGKFEHLYPKYIIIKNQILEDGNKIIKFFYDKILILLKFIKKLIIYSFSIILTIISLSFFWRIKKSLKILIELFKTDKFKIFLIKYIKNLIKSLLEIVSFFALILNHILPFHFKGLYDYYYGNSNKKKIKKKFLLINLNIFIEKWLDVIIFILSMSRLITINFYIYLIRKKGKINYFSLLIDNNYLIIDNSNTENRIKNLILIFIDLYISLLIILQIILGILNPFLSLKIIKDLYLYFISSKNELNVRYKDIVSIFIYKFHKTILLLLFVNFIYIPISLLSNIFAFWTFKYNYNLLIINNKKIYNKLKNIDNKYIENYKNNSVKTKSICSKYCNNLSNIIESLIYGYKIIFKMIFIHLNIVRIFIFWSKKIKNNYESFEKLIDEQFNLSIKEFIFTPFLFIFFIIEPWNYKYHLEFFKEKSFINKAKIFYELIKIFLQDIFIVFILILLLISIIDTIPTILLIIRSIKKFVFPTEENILTYNLNYKTNDFKYELRQIYYKNVKKITTTILFILNILLITRIIPLFKRSKPFFKKFFNKLKNNIKKFINNFVNFIFCKKRKIIENDKLTKLPHHVLSEICFYLNPSDINNLSQVNKKLNLKTNINFIWEKIFYNKYDKKLKEILNNEDYALFNHKNYDSYKESCKQCFYILIKQDINKRKELREKLINFSRIVEEETIESILNLPSLLLIIPRKILGFILFISFFVIHKILMFLSNFYDIIDYDFNSTYLELITDYKDGYYINIILFIIFEIIVLFLYLIVDIEIFIIQLLSFNFNLEDNNKFFIKNYSFFYIIIQLIIGFMYLFLKILIPLIPSIYYILYDLNFISKNNFYEIIKDLSDIIYQSKFKIYFQIFFGKYCLNIILIILTTFFNFIILNFLKKKSKIIFTRIIYHSLFSFAKKYYIFYPLTFFIIYFGISFRCISIKLQNKFKLFFDIILNIFCLIIGFIPFCFIFICFEKNLKKIIIIEVPLLIYSIINWFICGKILKKLDNIYKLKNI